MKHFYEVSLSCQWGESSICMNARKKTGTKRTGRYVWKKYETLVELCLDPSIWSVVWEASSFPGVT